MTGVTLLGPWPGTGAAHAQRTALDILTDVPDVPDVPDGVVGLPAVVQLPARGPWAESVPRTAALLTDMPVDLGPHGWQLTDRPGADLERTRGLLREDLEVLAAVAHGYQGPLVASVRGPWTMAAILYLARGDRVLSDHGACRDLVQSLAEGCARVVTQLREAVPGAAVTLVVREPMLPDVLAGTIATFSGRGRIPAVPSQDVDAGLAAAVDAARAAGAVQVVAHGGGRFASRALRALSASGADAVGLAAGAVRGPQWEQVAAVVEAGRRMWFGLPQQRRWRPAEADQLAPLIVRPWRAMGLDPAALADVVVHVETSASLSGGDLVLSETREVRSAVSAAAGVAGLLMEAAQG